MRPSPGGRRHVITDGDTRRVQEVAGKAAPSGMSARRRTIVLCLPLAALTAASLAGDALAPVLLAHHAAIVAFLAPRTTYLAAAASALPLPVFAATAIARLALGDPFHFLLGRLHGHRGVRRVSRLAPGLEGATQRVGLPAVVASPTGKVLLVAGAAGLPPRRVALADLAGTALRVLAIWAAARSLPDGAALASRVGWLAPLAVVVATVTTVARGSWRRASGRPR